MNNLNHHAEIIYSPCDTAGIYQIQIKNKMFDHFGYVWVDEAQQFSLKIYDSPEDAMDAMAEYAGYLN